MINRAANPAQNSPSAADATGTRTPRGAGTAPGAPREPHGSGRRCPAGTRPPSPIHQPTRRGCAQGPARRGCGKRGSRTHRRVGQQPAQLGLEPAHGPGRLGTEAEIAVPLRGAPDQQRQRSLHGEREGSSDCKTSPGRPL